MNNLDPAGKLFSSATAQPFLFACVLFQTKRHWGDKRLKASQATILKSLALLWTAMKLKTVKSRLPCCVFVCGCKDAG